MSTSSSSLTSSLGTVDLTSLIPALVAAKQAPRTALSARKTKNDDVATAYQGITRLLTTARTAVVDAGSVAGWRPLSASSSSPAVNATTTATGGTPSSLTFTVGQLATNHTIYSTATFPSTSAVVATPGASLVVGAGLGALGLGPLGGAGLANGAHTITVTAASAAARFVGSAATTPTAIDTTNDTIDLVVNGTATTVTLAHGTYATADALAGAVAGALASGPVGAGATASTQGGDLVLATSREGSAATLAITGGSALGALGLASGSAVGTDGVVEVDGTATTVTSVETGTALILHSASGAVTASSTGGLRTGTSSVRSVSVGDGSLLSAVAAINGAGAGVAAAAIQVSPGAYRLQLTSTVSGSAGSISLDLSAFPGAGGFQTLTVGRDATITVAGDNPYTITSASNTFTDVLPGVSFALGAGASGTVTVGSTRDTATLADRVAKAVTAVNAARADITTKTAYNVSAKRAAVLNGSGAARSLSSALTRAMIDPVTGATPTTASLAGLTMARDGSLSFDADAFTAACQKDPVGTERLFTNHGSAGQPAGVLDRLTTVIDDAVRVGTGSLRTAEQSARDGSKRISDQIDDLDQRVAAYQEGLKSRFGALNASLQNLTSQRTWLATQISSLPTS